MAAAAIVCAVPVAPARRPSASPVRLRTASSHARSAPTTTTTPTTPLTNNVQPSNTSARIYTSARRDTRPSTRIYPRLDTQTLPSTTRHGREGEGEAGRGGGDMPMNEAIVARPDRAPEFASVLEGAEAESDGSVYSEDGQESEGDYDEGEDEEELLTTFSDPGHYAYTDRPLLSRTPAKTQGEDEARVADSVHVGATPAHLRVVDRPSAPSPLSARKSPLSLSRMCPSHRLRIHAPLPAQPLLPVVRELPLATTWSAGVPFFVAFLLGFSRQGFPTLLSPRLDLSAADPCQRCMSCLQCSFALSRCRTACAAPAETQSPVRGTRENRRDTRCDCVVASFEKPLVADFAIAACAAPLGTV